MHRHKGAPDRPIQPRLTREHLSNRYSYWSASGDTTGLSALSPTDIIASWGSNYPAASGKQSEIYATNVTATLP